MSMYKVNCKFAEQEEMVLEVQLQEEEKTKKKKLLVLVTDAEGVRWQIGNFSMNDVANKKAVKSIAEVFPKMLFEVVEQTEKTEMEKVQEQLVDVVCNEKAVKSKQSMDIKMLHKAVCEYVKKHSVPDYYVIEDGMCKIRYDELPIILEKILGSGWKRLEFARGLALQGMVEEGSDRLPKKLADRTGVQHWTLVFSAQFKGVMR